MEFDVAIIGGNAMLAAVAASTSVLRGFSTLLAAESRLDGTPPGLLEHPAFRLWLDKLLNLEDGRVLAPGVCSHSIDEVARSLQHVAAARSLLVTLPDADAEFGAPTEDGERMIVIDPRKSTDIPTSCARLLGAMPAGANWRAIPERTRVAAFARRIVVAGMAPGLGGPELEPSENGATAAGLGAEIVLLGSAKVASLNSTDAVAEFMRDLCDVSDGVHLSGLKPRLR